MNIDKEIEINEILKGFNDLNSTINTLEESKTCTLQDLDKIDDFKHLLIRFFKFEGGGYYKDYTLEEVDKDLEDEDE